MKPTMNQTLIAAGCIAGAVLWIGAIQRDNNLHRRRLDMSFHLSQMQERDVVPEATYDTTRDQYMSSPCRPEYDGYFGSTSGSPYKIQYGFEMETGDEESVNYLLEEIHEQIQDVVLSSAFPNLCGFRRREYRKLGAIRRLSSSREQQLKATPRVTGFKFGSEIKQRNDICIPQMDATNLCGIYTNTMAIYGRHLEALGPGILAEVKAVIRGEQQRLSADGLVRLQLSDELTSETGDYVSSPTGIGALPFGVQAAIVVLIIAVFAGAATFAVYVCLEQKKQQRERRARSLKQSIKEASNRTLGFEEDCYASEKIGLRNGTAVVLDGGRPVVLEFDEASSRYREKDAIEDQRSEANSTIFDVAQHQSVPTGLGDVNEADQEPDGLLREDALLADRVHPADPTGISVVGSEYTEETASEEEYVHRGTFS